MDEDARTSRFSHILQPIRDLSENWSIDIANELEEYLDELEAITFSFDDGRTNLNFAEGEALAAIDAARRGSPVGSRGSGRMLPTHIPTSNLRVLTATLTFPTRSRAAHPGSFVHLQQEGRVPLHAGVPGP